MWEQRGEGRSDYEHFKQGKLEKSGLFMEKWTVGQGHVHPVGPRGGDFLPLLPHGGSRHPWACGHITSVSASVVAWPLSVSVSYKATIT